MGFQYVGVGLADDDIDHFLESDEEEPDWELEASAGSQRPRGRQPSPAALPCSSGRWACLRSVPGSGRAPGPLAGPGGWGARWRERPTYITLPHLLEED